MILSIEDNNALLLSTEGLEVMPYKYPYNGVTWEGSDIRVWLNNTFYNEAFMIQTAKENGLDPYRYLTRVLKKAPYLNLSDPSDVNILLPANAPADYRSGNIHLYPSVV